MIPYFITGCLVVEVDAIVVVVVVTGVVLGFKAVKKEKCWLRQVRVWRFFVSYFPKIRIDSAQKNEVFFQDFFSKCE